MSEVNWSPVDYGWGQREGQRVFYKQNFDLREIRPNIWLLRKRVNKVGTNEGVEYLIKFLQYIPPTNSDLAKLLLETYLHPRYDKEFNINIE